MAVKINGSTGITFEDNDKQNWGTGNDLEIYHNGSHSYIHDNGTGALKIRTNELQLLNAAGDEYFLSGIENGAASLYYDNSKKLEASSEGIYIGNAAVNSALPTGTNHSGFAFSSDQFYTSTTGTGSNTQVRFYNGNGLVGYIETNGSATTYHTSSDYRLKENEVAISDGITRLKTLKPYRFNFKADSSKTIDGFFAHEVTPAVPEAISGEKDGTEMQSIDYSKLVPLLTAALQEAITEIDILKVKVAELEAG